MYQLHTGFVRIFRVREAKAWVWPMLGVLFAFPCGGSIGCVESSRVQGGEGVKWQMATPPPPPRISVRLFWHFSEAREPMDVATREV